MVVLLGTLAAVACVPGASPPPPPDKVLAPAVTPAPPPAPLATPPATPPSDTLRGIVEVVGSEPGTSVILLDAGGGAVTLVGERDVLEALTGLEVAVKGRREAPGSFHVEQVAVRAANGVPAVDGVIAHEGGRLVLLTGDGRRLPVPHLPAELASQVGARVWLAGPLDRPPDSFGVVVPPR